MEVGSALKISLDCQQNINGSIKLLKSRVKLKSMLLSDPFSHKPRKCFHRKNKELG